MARKKKKETVRTFIFFEIVGLVIIGLSIIALTQSDSFIARLLSSMTTFLLGNVDFLIPLLFIYIGLFVMIKRAWPVGWTKRRAGVLLLLCSLLLFIHVSFFNNNPDISEDSLTSRVILSHTWGEVWQSIQAGEKQPEVDTGGGMAGSILYSISYLLLRNVGSYLLMLLLFMISLILIFNLSYVAIGGWVRTFFAATKDKSNRVTSKQQQSEIVDTSDPWYKKIFRKTDGHKLEENIHPPVDVQSIQSEDEHENESPYSDESDEPFLIRNFNESTNELESVMPIQKATSVHHEHIEEVDSVFPVKQLELPLYSLPGLQLLNKPIGSGKQTDQHDVLGNAKKLEKTLESFGVKARVIEVHRGPAVTRFELQPDTGVKVSRIVSLTDDIALALAAKDIRMEAPIPGKSAIGIEVPNSEVAVVTMREVMESSAFSDSNAKLTIAFGRDISGQAIVGNLAKMPHLLVAGATGSGKSVCINGIIISILFKAKPDEVKFLMVDPKMVELNMYNGIPHLLAPVVTDPRRASLALKKVVVEMEQRYELFAKTATRNIEGYNALAATMQTGEPPADGSAPLRPLPYIVVIVDELADLMMVAAGDVEDAICRLAQMARAAGIHLIIATQRPSVDVITGVIKANIPSRIAFGVSSQIDSRTILDAGGAEKLLGRGDMLYMPVGANKPMRVQGAFLSDKEVETVVQFCRNQEQVVYREDLVPEVEETSDQITEFEDDLFDQAVMIVLEGKQASVSYLQRRLRIGYTRAARLIDMMEAKHIVGPYEGSKPREVLMTVEQFQTMRSK